MSAKENAGNLLRVMRITKGSQFGAAARLRKRSREMTYAISFTSVYVIALTVMPSYITLPKDVVGLTNAITILFSLIILVISLMQYAYNDSLNAELLSRCAIDISEIISEVEVLGEKIDDKSVIDFKKKYNSYLRGCSVPHANVDFYNHLIHHPGDVVMGHGRGKIRRFIELKILFAAVVVWSKIFWVCVLVFETIFMI